MTETYVVLPGDVDDPERPSGGNAYGRRICAGLPAAGRPVRELRAHGTWPRPSAAQRARLRDLLAAVPDGADVLLDGLVACPAPDALAPHAARLRLAVLVHLPLGDEWSLRNEHGYEAGAPAELVEAERATLRAAAVVVATSPWTAARLRAVHGIDARVASPGVDPAPLTDPDPAGTRLLCLGSLTPTKGQDLLVEALSRLGDRSWTCTLAGPLVRDPAHVAAVRAALARHGLAGRVTITGPRAGRQLDDVWAATDLLVLPSRAETWGMVVGEALARGIPVIAFAVGGVPEHLDGGGELVPAADVAALAEALRRWLDEPARRRRARAAARSRRRRLSGWEVTCQCLDHALSPSPA